MMVISNFKNFPILEKVYDDGDDIFEEDSDEDKDILEEVFDDGDDIFESILMMLKTYRYIKERSTIIPFYILEPSSLIL